MRVLLLCGILFGASMLHAQSGLRGGADGMRQIPAQSLGYGQILFGVGMEVASGYNLLADRSYVSTHPDGSEATVNVDSRRPFAWTGYANLGVGLSRFWDLGASMPVHYDHLRPARGENDVAMDNGRSAGPGDLQLHTRLRLPFSPDFPVQFAFIGILQTPTGKTNAGFYPRQLVSVGKDGHSTDPFTTGVYTTGGGMAFTLDLRGQGVPWRLNAHALYQHPWQSGHDDVFSWGLGMNRRSSEFVTSFAELSGEHRRRVLRTQKNLLSDRMLASAGLRFHLPGGWDLGLAADMSPIDRNDIQVTQSNAQGVTRYTVGNLNFGGSALLVYHSGRRTIDQDQDGVPDGKDRCPGTDSRAKVDAQGCPLDQDKDGVPDYLDQCPDTPPGMAVLANGCTVDSDQDGIPDSLDRCPNTPLGIPVDAQGCAKDSDGDKVPDHLDRCPNTPQGAVVDEQGCPLDTDGDGIPDHQDRCPNTPSGVAIDETGCPRDMDGDGVLNEFDKCPNTPPGLEVNQDGCPADTDGDGVPDHQDRCPNTPKNVAVDTLGCPLDTDGDGVPDYLDKCPRTLKGVAIDSKGCPLRKEQDLTQLQRAINFKTGSAELTTASYRTLDLVVALLKAIPAAKLEIQGHTDNTGSDEINRKLSHDRALAVGLYFISQGIEKSRLRPVGYGPTQPIRSNDTRSGRDANRRVELVPFD